jgi:hypothetical protein
MKIVIVYIIAIITAGCLLTSCSGSKDVCEKARDVVRDWCVEYEAEDCLPFACAMRGQDWMVIIEQTPLGPRVDYESSGCVDLGPCDGALLEESEACLDDRNTCDPCNPPALGINMCNNPAFPQFCEPIW